MTATLTRTIVERPILFSGPMVRAVLDGTKTQTRRVALHKRRAFASVGFDLPWIWAKLIGAPDPHAQYSVHCPYGQPGDRLWVRETHWRDARDPGVVIYDATAEFGKYQNTGKVVRSEHPNTGITGERPSRADMEREMATNPFWSRRPSIFLPRWASRLTLELTGVRVERVQDISDEDIRAEGSDQSNDPEHWRGENRASYAALWDSLNAARGYGWDANPWVWVLSFARVTP